MVRKKRENMILSGRGQAVFDILIFLIVITVLAVSFVIGYKVYGDMNAEIQADTTMSNESKAFSANINTEYPNFMDTAFLLALVLFWVLLLVSSFMIDSHPVFFIVTIILLFFVFMIGMVMANTYQDIMSDSDLSATANQFPTITWVYSNLLIILIAIGFSTALVLYAKNKL